ncbi:MAG: ATP synthase subunit delta [Candidatus Moranbacteria bacterium GW2011_GWF2_36_839]|nr:MAG: ATP synthase subunit delta [Candidatus Moranbacteria bacterium GW2011_GWF1_36_78]KKQ16573.1 MAG: ATP synthase subunit delta [Candidatus Moranbacteria bacterium GW2011_GWF2_36_839]HAT73983.1 ATP synthase F1 subunit delta [Candidatus Moranbacteria bacterium]HBY10879.1 ATP synthase F1 subunit delta [Candidatus Moranbacteria bacterium]
MKITATQYAKSLYEVTREKSQSEIGVVTENFVKVLAKNRQAKLAVKIIKKFEELYNKENGIAEVEAISSRKLEADQIGQIEKFIKEKYSAREVLINNKIDENIKGGIILKIGDEIMDASVERQLRELKKSLVKL